MDHGEASQTSIVAALLRAAHQWRDADPKILADPVVERLLDPGSRDYLPQAEARAGSDYLAALRSLFVVRSRFAEDDLDRAVARGVTQYVLLGAGLDTFAFRQPPFAGRLRIFEVDHPATQAWKRERLAAVGLADPSNMVWVPVDFEHDALDERLTAAGFDLTRPAVFSWLGVVYYLTWPAIELVLRFVASLPRPTTIVLDSMLPPEELTGFAREVCNSTAKHVTERGESIQTYLRPLELEARLRALGFAEVAVLTPEEVHLRYFAGRRDALRVPTYAVLASATV